MSFWVPTQKKLGGWVICRFFSWFVAFLQKNCRVAQKQNGNPAFSVCIIVHACNYCLYSKVSKLIFDLCRSTPIDVNMHACNPPKVKCENHKSIAPLEA